MYNTAWRITLHDVFKSQHHQFNVNYDVHFSSPKPHFEQYLYGYSECLSGFCFFLNCNGWRVPRFGFPFQVFFNNILWFLFQRTQKSSDKFPIFAFTFDEYIDIGDHYKTMVSTTRTANLPPLTHRHILSSKISLIPFYIWISLLPAMISLKKYCIKGYRSLLWPM